MCSKYENLRPILNVACKEDPAKLGKSFGATNLDIETFCTQTKTNLPQKVPNFINGNVLEMSSIFTPGFYKLIVVGEFIEHCVVHCAVQALTECHKVLSDDGLLVLTFPLDDRPPEQQHAADQLRVIVPGETGTDITVWHQTVWTDEMLGGLFLRTGFREIERQTLSYGFVGPKDPQGWGIILEKQTT